jgi:hypothetical protein
LTHHFFGRIRLIASNNGVRDIGELSLRGILHVDGAHFGQGKIKSGLSGTLPFLETRQAG